ncbi:hypothetical protein GCM10009821_22920 [Aeromicrobium halocynthiae]|uniref:Cytochrome c oxidase assembly protein n=1 Tax=Aeromicrobium halocynthiae TaxID=560557 RepID=A0ABN2W2J8_9ACTN
MASSWRPPTGLEPAWGGRAVGLLVVAAALTQVYPLYGDIEAGLWALSAVAAICGVVAGLRVDGIAAMQLAARREPQPSLFPTLWPLFLAPVLTAVVGLPLVLPLVVQPDEDASVLLMPLVLALLVTLASLLGWLVCGLVLWPLVHLVRWVLRRRGGEPDAALVVLSSLSLLLVTALSTVMVPALPADGRSGLGILRVVDDVVRLWTIDGEDSRRQGMLLAARLLFVATCVSVVAWVAVANRTSRRRRRRPTVDDPPLV